ncbi:hypothetical protein MY10362_007502 [Beauveria mimosiformis]
MVQRAIVTESALFRQCDVLSEFSVSKNGFLPADNPLDMLPNVYYQPWEAIAHNLSALVKRGIRQAVTKLPLLGINLLASEAEWRRAYVILAFMANAYVWGGDKPEEPRACGTSAAQKTTYQTLIISRRSINFSGTESESWFILTGVAIEAKAASIISTAMAALDAVKIANYGVVIHALEQFTSCIQEITVQLDRMQDKCDPMIFYHHIRPFLAGFEGMEDAGLPRGVFMTKLFDIVLGVAHNSHGSAGKRSYHDEAMEYMPGGHRRLLIHMAQFGSIRTLAMNVPPTPEGECLRKAFNTTVEMLRDFRSKHMQIVTRYIILPSKQPCKGARQNLATLSSASGSEDKLTGTSGTPVVSFLKQVREETVVTALHTAEKALEKVMFG